ncbi:MAG: outer membrane protein assembly factor BamE [Clostridia bacterium]|nr:outer membrane protein assembly factor BamE [Clostridia bacterium]
MGIFGILLIVFLVAFISKTVSDGNAFRDNSQKIHVGMTTEQVLNIMGEPSFVKRHQDGNFEVIYERSEWKGVWRGGTKTRRMELLFSADGILTSIGKNKNCDMSGW